MDFGHFANWQDVGCAVLTEQYQVYDMPNAVGAVAKYARALKPKHWETVNGGLEYYVKQTSRYTTAFRWRVG